MKQAKKSGSSVARRPSVESLKEIPEITPKQWAHRRSKTDPARMLAEGYRVRLGRPKKGAKVERSEPKSVRFPPSFWRDFEKRAKARGLTLHSALRAAAMQWMEHGR